jgi:hypothetical protein
MSGPCGNVAHMLKKQRGRSRRWPDSETGPWEVTTIWQQVGERRECVGVEVVPAEGADPTPLTTIQLRKLKFGEIVEADRLAERNKLRRDAMRARAHPDLFSRDALARLNEQMNRERVRDPRRRGRPVSLTAEHYAQVAEIYRAAVPSGAPVQAVADHYTTSPGTAARWVGKARTLGLLPPTTRGKARGED